MKRVCKNCGYNTWNESNECDNCSHYGLKDWAEKWIEDHEFFDDEDDCCVHAGLMRAIIGAWLRSGV